MRERLPLKREYKCVLIINIADIFRNEDVQNEVIKQIKLFKRKEKNETDTKKTDKRV